MTRPRPGRPRRPPSPPIGESASRGGGPDARALRAAVDLPDLCLSLGIELEQQYDGRWTGLCPFHPDRNPSFGCYQGDDGTWRCGCWSCQPFAGDSSTGDCFDLVRAWEAREGRRDPGFLWAVGEVVRLTGGRGPAERHRDEVLARLDAQGRDDIERAQARVEDAYRRGYFGTPMEETPRQRAFRLRAREIDEERDRWLDGGCVGPDPRAGRVPYADVESEGGREGQVEAIMRDVEE